MSPTPGLGIDTHASSGAGSYAVANEAYAILELMAGRVLQDFLVDTPPVTPDDGDAYVLGSSPTGAWAGQAGNLALYLNGGWVFKTIAGPEANGLRFIVSATAPTATLQRRTMVIFNENQWRVDAITSTDPIAGTHNTTLNYRFGSRWLNSTGGREYICTSSDGSSANWVQTTGGSGGGSAATDITAVSTTAPAVITIGGDHAVYNGQPVTITDVNGTGGISTALNGNTFYANVLTSTTFSIYDTYTDLGGFSDPVNGAGWGYTGNGIIAPGAPTGSPDQDIWATIVGDSGSTTADTTADALTIEGYGGVGLSTSITGDVLTITQAIASDGVSGALVGANWRQFWLASISTTAFSAAGFGTSVQPGAPSDGELHIIGDGSISGTNGWTNLNLFENDIAVWSAAGSNWRPIQPYNGMVVGIDAAAANNWTTEVYPDEFLGSAVVWSEAAQRWYPLKEVRSNTAYFSGEYTPSGVEIWIRYFTGAVPTDGSNISVAMGVSTDSTEPRIATGRLYSPSIHTMVPGIIGTNAISVTTNPTNIIVNMAGVVVSGWSYELRLEYTPA